MCGLVGLAGNIGFKGEKIFRRLLELDTIRGPHSTGILGVNTKGECTVVKQTGTPWDLYEYKSCENLFRNMTNVLLGHNRWATKGKVNRQNAHPFEFDNIVGAHNGTLNSVMNLDDHKDFDVDSENIYHHMNKHGVYETIPLLNGAFALTWYDKKDATINLIRNAERPLYYTFSKDQKTLIWASEPWMIEVTLKQGEMEHNEIVLLPIGVLHTFEVPMGYPAVTFDKARIRKIELYQKPNVVIRSTTARILRPTIEAKINQNVVSIDKGKVLGKTKRPFSEYQKYIGKPCVFYVGHADKSGSGQHYIQCWAAGDDDIAIRCFPQHESPLWNKMMESPNFFKGVPKAYNGLDGGYITVDIRTIEEDDASVIDVPQEDTIVGFGGEIINEALFDMRTGKGCAWCSSHVTVEDHAEIHWIGRDEFICPICGEEEEVQTYLSMTKH